MNRLKLLATATLMALTFTACDEGTPPPVEPPPPPTPVGTISGTVTIEGTAASGITATLSSGATTTTGSGGSFAFSGVEAGTYTVTISGFPEDATFAQVTQSATIATDGQNVQLNFAGEYIRSSSVVGNVVAADAMMSGGDGQPETLVGVTVTLGGEHAMGETMETAEDGGFMFTGLRAGTYTVTISDFPEDVSFETVSVEVEVEVGEVGTADFTGHYIRTSAVEGQVVIEGEGLAGVTVTLSGGPADESYTMLTDADGMYRFEELRPGEYTVSISDFDTRDYEFAATSQDVSVDLDETGTVSFTGVLLRTSGIAGRVSVEGMGLGGIEVTLSGAADASTMTDDGGQYSFAGLAAGEYTVSIAVESAAYVFESMSADVTLGDDESAIQNFEGAHARTASVSGMVFLDELMKNNMFDEGEHPLPAAGIPVALVGPGVNEQRLGATDATGAFSFTGLQAGPYQLVVLVDAQVAAALAAADVAYGGPGEGYALALGVGEAAAQNIPFDITHTTINVAVTLKGGDYRGDPVPGASVTLYADADGETKVGSGMTEASQAGVYTSIKVARAGTSDNTVHMAVAADGYFVDPTAGMQAVTWNPQSFTHPPMVPGASPEDLVVLNDADIVNLGVDVSVSGATVTTDYGGGDALAGWAITVLSGDPTDPTSLMPVEGAPAMLGAEDADDEGMASLKTAVMPTDLPASFVFALAADQDDKMDGGEKYAAQPVVYTHTGLKLAGNMDAGTLEAAFTTQTLKVYVHHERDQVEGYTGSILGGDERMSGKIDVGIRYIAENGRSRTFSREMWDPKNKSDKDGVVTFSHVPADANVIAVAAKAADAGNVMLLDPDELSAYNMDMEGHGIMGGAFGAMGGFSHTVSLCPLQRVDPTGQDHGECASFAFVSTHSVSGLVWKRSVSKSGDDFAEKDPVFVAGQTVSLDPVAGKNLAGEPHSQTTTEKNDKDTPRDDTHQFDFGSIAAGVYKVSVPSGWRAMLGGKGSEAAVGNALNPLAGDVALDVTPATATVYGRVNGSDGFPLDSVSVTANGMSVQTDASGRFIIDGIAAQTRKIDDVTHSNKIFLQGSRAGFDDSDLMILEFAANSLTRNDFAMGGTAKTATISGTVTAFGSTTGVSGVEIRVDGNAPENKNAKSMSSAPKNDIYVTGDDGSYSIKVPAKATGMTSRISAHKDGYTFTPAHLDLSTPDGAAISGINFQAVANSSISGRVQAPGGGPLGGVAVTATGSTGSDADTTGVTGTYSLSVPAGTYTMAFAKDGYSFTCPGEPASCSVTVGLGQSVTLGDAMSVVDETIATLSALSLSGVTLDPAFSSDVTDYSADVANDVEQTTVTATTTDSNASVEVLPAEADDAMDGHQVALSVGTTRITATVTAADSSTTETYTVDVTRANVHPTVTLMLSADTIAEAADDGTGTNVVQTATVTAMVSPMADSAFTVTVSIGDDTWATLSDSVTLSFAANAAASTGTVTITTVDDNVYTGNRTVTVSGASSDAAVAADPADVMLTITDNETGQVPGAVQGLAAEAGDRQVKVTWGQPLNTGSDPITGYKWTATTANRLPLNGEVGAAARELTITNLENGLAYSLSVWAVNAAGETATGDRATAVTATPVPVITLTLSENSLTEGGSDTLTATVSLSSVSNVEVSVAVAEIVDGTARLTVEGSPVTIPVGQMTPAAGGTPITVFAQDNATDDGDAAAMLQATSANGADSDTLEVTIVDDDEVPGAPRNLTLTAGDATITAEWISPADAGSAAITSYQYRVYETADGAPAADAADQGWETATSPQAAATVTTADGDPAVENDTEYTVEVRAVSTAGNGAIASATATPASS